MAREIRGASQTGTLYARILNSAGLWWNGTTFEAYVAANWANYDVAMTEQGDSDVYFADFPAAITAGGTYEYYVHQQAGGSPAEGDDVINVGQVDWTGSAAVQASSSAMTGSDFYSYLLRRGLVRTDKSTEAYEAVTDAIQEMRRRFGFSEAQADSTTTDTISTLGDYKLAVESDHGLLNGVVLQDGTTAVPLTGISKAKFDQLYPDAAVTADRGYPEHYCVYANQIYLGPIPDDVDYTYRLSYSKRAGTVTSSTTGVPFTDVYRDALAELTLGYLYEGLDEFEKADRFLSKFEAKWIEVIRRERKNGGQGCFAVQPQDC